MRKLLNTLYVTTPEAYISRDGTNVVVSVKGTELGRVPIGNVQQIASFTYAGMSPSLMGLCVENGVSVSFHSPSGRFLASVNGEAHGNVLLRRAQFRAADDPAKSLEIARNMITAKTVNGLALVRKGLSNHPDVVDRRVDSALGRLTDLVHGIGAASTMEELRGMEGDAARVYFSLVDDLIRGDRDAFRMTARSRRPPRDRFNALLSFTYSMLMNDVRSALDSVGLDPYVGFMHTDRPGRPSLALDMMEELRPMADRLVLRLVNLRMVDAEGFVEREGGAVMMDDETRRSVIDAWQTRKRETVRHPFIGESVQVGMVPYVQAMLLAKHLRGEIDGYPPYMVRKV